MKHAHVIPVLNGTRALWYVPGTGYGSVVEEGAGAVEWIEGHVPLDSPEVAALCTTFVLRQ